MRVVPVLVGVLVAGMLPAQVAVACKTSVGETAKEKKVAADVCKIYEKNVDVESVWVKGPIMGINISERLYRGLRDDRVGADKVVRDWLGVVQAASGKTAVGVWVFWDSTKVIEGDVNVKGEKVVRFVRP